MAPRKRTKQATPAASNAAYVRFMGQVLRPVYLAPERQEAARNATPDAEGKQETLDIIRNADVEHLLRMLPPYVEAMSHGKDAREAIVARLQQLLRET